MCRVQLREIVITQSLIPWAIPPAISSERCWLPVPPEHRPLAVDRQRDDAGSLLSYFTQLLHWRRDQPALWQGDMDLLPADEQVLAYVRTAASQRVLCAFNFSETPASLTLPADWSNARVLEGSGLGGARIEGGTIVFEPWGGLFLQV